MLQDDLPALEFLAALVEGGKFTDAVRFMAHLFSKRNAVWWACQCARQARDKSPAALKESAIKAAEEWVSDMTEDTRYVAFDCANKAGLGTAAGCAAMAAFASGASLAPREDPIVAPAGNLTGHLVAGSVLIAAAAEPEKMTDHSRAFLEQGRQLYEETGE